MSDFSGQKEKAMKPIRECEREERYLRTLIVIENIGTDLARMDDKIPEDEAKRYLRFASDAYCMAHAAVGHCAPHDDWLNRIDEAQDQLCKANVVNTDKIVKEIFSGKKNHSDWPFRRENDEENKT